MNNIHALFLLAAFRGGNLIISFIEVSLLPPLNRALRCNSALRAQASHAGFSQPCLPKLLCRQKSLAETLMTE
jgi:hypothetical protein